MKRKSIMTLLVLSNLIISGCNNSESSFSSESSESSISNIIDSSSSSVDNTPVFGEDGWDEDRLNYVNPNPTLKTVATEDAQWFDYSNGSAEEKTIIVGELEKYLLNNHLTGLPLCSDGGYIKYSDRVVLPTATKKDCNGNDIVINGTTRHEHIYGYGFGEISEGKLQGELTGDVEFPSYYHKYEEKDPLSLNESIHNYWDNPLTAYVTNVFFNTRLSANKMTYEWFPSLASEENKLSNGTYRPLPLKVLDDGSKSIIYNPSKNEEFSNYRIYVRTGEGVLYNTLSTKEEIKEYKGRQVQLEDYITPYKEIHNQSNNIIRGSNNLSGMASIKGMEEYYYATSEGYNQEAWDNVGLKPGEDSKGTYIDFELRVKCTPFYAMYYLSNIIYTPIPKSFVDLVGGYANLFSFVNDTYTPVDTTLSVGPYCVEQWNKNESIVFKKNELIADEINGGNHRYQIPGIHVAIYEQAANDQNFGYNLFKNGLIDSAGIPLENSQEEANAKGTQTTSSGSITSLSINSCDQQMWEYLFGENGTIKKTNKEDYWDVKPAMSNDNFLKGIHLSINRKEFAEKRGVTPSIDLFGDACSVDFESFTPYNKTQVHKDALLSYYGSKKLIDSYGYDFDLAVNYFNKAATELLQTGAYKEGDVIEIEICWQAQSQANERGKEIEQYIEKAFNDERVCNNKLSLNINTTFTQVWSDVYYEKTMCGQFDISLAGYPGSSNFNIAHYMEAFKSDNSSGFTLSWGEDTNSTETLIDYDGKKFTYDALWRALDFGTLVEPNGKNATLYDATIVSNTLNEDDSRTIVINYDFSSIEGVIDIDIEKLELWWYDSDNISRFDYKEIDYVDDGNGTITITINKDTASTWLGDISIDLILLIKYNQEKTCWRNYIYLESEFNISENE